MRPHERADTLLGFRVGWPRPWVSTALLVGLVQVLAACTERFARAPCEADRDCAADALCYIDGRCLPPDEAVRLGATLADECGKRSGTAASCDEGEACKLGRCVALPTDPQDVDDESDGDSDPTPEEDTEPDFELPECVDYAADVQPLFNARCTLCHGGPTPLRGLSLETYGGAMAGGGSSASAVVACSPSTSLLIDKVKHTTPTEGARMPFGGPYLSNVRISLLEKWVTQGARASCAEANPCDDTTAPTFGGLTSVTLDGDGASVELCWSAATDDKTAPSELIYEVYEAATSGAQPFASTPAYATAAGESCLVVNGLLPSTQYCWVALARDRGANRGGDPTNEGCVTTPAASCVDYATHIQPLFDGRCLGCHSGANRSAGLSLDSYAEARTGSTRGEILTACRPDLSVLFEKVSSPTPSTGVRMPEGGPPLDAVAVDLLRQWIAFGARASCADTDPCTDATPPTFAGASSVLQPDNANPTMARLCWAAASDDVTAAGSLVYDLYRGPAPGAVTTSGPPTMTSDAGASCVEVPALSPEATYCFIVRARDAAGNQDANTVEQCLTMGALPSGCVDYASLVQPLLDANCVRCHSGPLSPQRLELDSYAHVLAGSVRRNTVAACSVPLSLLVNKVGPTPFLGARMPSDGSPHLTAAQVALVEQWIQTGARKRCADASPCDDTTPPVFAGAASATAIDAKTVRVCWNSASDPVTPTDQLVYAVHEKPGAGTYVFTEPAQHAVSGEACVDIATAPSTEVCVVVRARDLAGNRDTNTAERCATTPAAACAVEFASEVTPILRARCAHCHTGQLAARAFDVSSLGRVLAGGALRRDVLACNWSGSLLKDKVIGAQTAVRCGGRMPADGPPYLAPSEIAVLQAWVTSGARATCADPNPCGDSTSPTFAGVKTAVAGGPERARLCWDAAVDATTPASAIVYDVYEATFSGRQDFTAPAPYAAPAGDTCIDLSVPPGERACWVVRARDPVGNRDTNTAERCLTMPAACVDFEAHMSPIFSQRCVHCHGPNRSELGVRWDSHANAMSTGDVAACEPTPGKLVRYVDDCFMPYDTGHATPAAACRACLSPMQKRMVRSWIHQGAHASCPNAGTCP